MRRTLLFIFVFSLTAFFGFSQPPKVAIAPHIERTQLQFIENKKQWWDGILFKTNLPFGSAFFEKNKITYQFIKEEDAHKFEHPHHSVKVGDIIHLHAFSMEFLNENADVKIKGQDTFKEYHNYFTGNQPEHWASHVHLYKNVVYENLYQGINLKYSSIGNSLKYELEVQPFADAALVKIKYNNAGEIKLKNGLLHIKTSVNELIEQAPYTYQIIDGQKKIIPSEFILKHNEISFKLSDYDHSQKLIIDPTLIFCTYTGSTTDNWGSSATYDNAGNLYAAGIATNLVGFGSGYLGYSWGNSGYPTTLGAFQTQYGGGDSIYANWNPYFGDMSIAKFNSTGTAMIYSTFLGGSDNDYANSLIVTPNNELIVFGRSYSTNYPVTSGCYQNTNHGSADIVITKFNAAGSALIGSTYIGGSNADGINYSPLELNLGSLKRNYGDDARGEVNLDASGNIYLAACTMSSNFPVTTGCYQHTFGGGLQDGVVMKFNANLTSLSWATYMGGTLNDACYSLDVDNTNNTVFVTGGTESLNFPTTSGAYNTTYQGGTADGFLFHLNATGTSLLASTFVGTNQYDQSYFVKLDRYNNPYIFGQTSGAYPVVGSVYSNAGSGQFVTEFNPTLSNIVVSTVVGNGSGSPNISPVAFTVDHCASGDVYLAGWGGYFFTYYNSNNVLQNFGPGQMPNMPLTANAIQTTTDEATASDFYIMVLGMNLHSLVFGSYYGGNGSIEHVDGGTNRFDKNGYIYGAICSGCGGNSLLQATPNAYSSTNNSFNCNLAAFRMFVTSPTTIAASPDSFNCKPFFVQFNCTSLVPYYKWNFGDGSPIDTTRNPTHTFVNSGTYHVQLIATDSSTCNIHDTVYLNIVCRNDSVHAKIILPPDTLCKNSPIHFSSSNNFSTTNYYWTFGDGGSSTAQNPFHSYVSAGSYVVKLVVNDTSICYRHDSMSVVVHVGLFNVADSFHVNRTHTCSLPAPFIFNGFTNNASGYYWDFGDGTPHNNSSLNITHTYIHSGTFIAKLIAWNYNACDSTDTFSVTIFVDSFFTKAKASPLNTFGCLPLNIQFHDSSFNALNYQWNFGDGTTSIAASPNHIYNQLGVFLVTLITNDSNTCNKSDTFKMHVRTDTSYVHSIASASPTTGCSPLSVQFTALNNNATSVIWYLGNGNTSTQSNFNFIYNDTLHYTVILIATDTNKCNKHDTSTVFIDPYFTQPFAKFSLSDTAACGNLPNVLFTNLSLGQTTNAWNFGDNTSSILQNPPSKNYSVVGDYKIKLVVTNPNDCVVADSTSQWVHVWQVAIDSFFIQPKTILKSDSLFSFINASQDADSYEWFVDGVLISNAQDFYQSWHPLGFHKICLVAKTKNNCNDTMCRLVQVEEVPYIGVPNAFSPNGDGENDEFRIYGIGIEEVDFKVYNRWGELVFHTTDRNQGWDGTYKGKPQEMEAYAWTLNATLITGEKKVMKGNVTLVR